MEKKKIGIIAAIAGAPSFFYHSWSGYYTAVLTAFLLSPTLISKT